MIKNYIVIGAGLSGLNMTRKISELGLGSVLVLEKSRGLGGRMATRRTLETRFDHGAQFYRAKHDISQLHQKWKEHNVSHQWFVSVKGDHWCSPNGMTALAKLIAANLEIKLETEVRTIQNENGLWKVVTDKNEEWLCHNLIVTSPLPQTVRLLEDASKAQLLNSQIYSEIKGIHYTKALIGLVTLDSDIQVSENGYVEFSAGDFFSIADQKKKGVSSIASLTLTMSPEFSESEFESPNELALEKILKALHRQFPEAKVRGAELKKWRFCQPKSQYKGLFAEIAPQLYLIGDAFGGSSLIGAVRSSGALLDALIEKSK